MLQTHLLYILPESRFSHFSKEPWFLWKILETKIWMLGVLVAARELLILGPPRKEIFICIITYLYIFLFVTICIYIKIKISPYWCFWSYYQIDHSSLFPLLFCNLHSNREKSGSHHWPPLYLIVQFHHLCFSHDLISKLCT